MSRLLPKYRERRGQLERFGVQDPMWTGNLSSPKTPNPQLTVVGVRGISPPPYSKMANIQGTSHFFLFSRPHLIPVQIEFDSLSFRSVLFLSLCVVTVKNKFPPLLLLLVPPPLPPSSHLPPHFPPCPPPPKRKGRLSPRSCFRYRIIIHKGLTYYYYYIFLLHRQKVSAN